MNNSSEIKQDVIDLKKLSAQTSRPSEKMRYLKGSWAKLVTVVGIISSLFHFYTGGFKPLTTMQQRPIHLAFVLFLIFLVFPSSEKQDKHRNPTLIDLSLSIVGAGSSLYLAYHYVTIVRRGGYMVSFDMIVGLIFLILILEAARRVIGKFIVILAGVFIAYLFFGHYVPGMFSHAGYSLSRVVHHMYMTTEGIFGIAIGVSATYVYLFVLFGAFLNKSGLTELFANFALALAGHSPGGPAKVAVIASGLMGTIQGSSAANVAATGMFTIPLMKSIGYQGYFAAAVEAVASCGGQFLPPVMGASAFIMAEYLGIPYVYVAAGAVLPAILYYSAVYFQVHLRAKKIGLEGVSRDRLPPLIKVIKLQGHLIIPVIVLVVMLINQYTALFAAFCSIIAVIVVSSFRKSTRMSINDIKEALVLGAKNVLSTAIACAVVGYVVGAVNLAGVGLLITQSIVRIGEGSLLLTLILAAGASLIMSQGLPTTSVYIINATLIAPGLVRLGVAPLVAHLFTYYWGGISAITPPVALAVYVGAGIAGSDIMKTGYTAMRLGMAGYLVPFYFVYWPVLVSRAEGTITEITLALLGGAVAVFCMALVGENYFTRKLPLWKLSILIICIVLIIYPSYLSQIIATAVAFYVGVSEYLVYKKSELSQKA